MASHPVHDLRRQSLTFERASDVWKVDETRADYMAHVSHDARSLLSALVSNIDWLRSELESANPQVAEGLADVETCCERLTGLLEDALLASRPQGLDPQLSLVGVGALGQAVLRRLRKRMEVADVVVEVTSERDVPVLMDRFLMARVFERLIDEALHRMPAEARLRLAYSSVCGSVVVTLSHLSDQRPSGEVLVGTTPSSLREAPASAERSLTFCEIAVRAHGGSIWFRPEEGVLWQLRLPLTPPVASLVR